MSTSAAFHALGAEIVCHSWNCVAASTLQVNRQCTRKEGSTGLVMLQFVPKVS